MNIKHVWGDIMALAGDWHSNNSGYATFDFVLFEDTWCWNYGLSSLCQNVLFAVETERFV